MLHEPDFLRRQFVEFIDALVDVLIETGEVGFQGGEIGGADFSSHFFHQFADGAEVVRGGGVKS